MSFTIEPVRVATGEDGDGVLVFKDGWLVAVLVQLSEIHAAHAGHWFLEAGFGRLDVRESPTFPDLGEAEAWIAAQLARHLQ